MPNEYGKKKHPLFFLDCLRKKVSINNQKLNNVSSTGDKLLGNVEEVDGVLKEQRANN